MSGSWQAERGTTSARAEARRLPREDPSAEVGENVCVGVGPMEFQLNAVRLSVCHAVSFSKEHEPDTHDVLRASS